MNTRNQKSTQLRAIGYTTHRAVRELKRLIVPGVWEQGMEVSFGQFTLM